MTHPEHFLRTNKGLILVDDRELAKKFLLEIADVYNKGPKKLSDQEKLFLKSWLRKMFERSNNRDIDGEYRLHWMLTDSLDIYFQLSGLWYLCPKKSFAWLKENDIPAYALFKKALSRDAEKTDIERLIDYLDEM
ncbi:hypothetical protein [Bacillus massiliglaciei]|uniref:hypothetical protein n=1 Tax=Bacillus massiliglaciei TaxID=1816693 RepID=UPI000DA5F8D1|nr:hypothetical protein [Bacillus massiliglaciei]